MLLRSVAIRYCHNLNDCGASVAPASQIGRTAILLLLIVRNLKERRWDTLKRHILIRSSAEICQLLIKLKWGTQRGDLKRLPFCVYERKRC
jgi:hypothetical protein